MLPGDGPTDPPTMSDGEIIERLEGDVKRLQAEVAELKRSHPSYANHLEWAEAFYKEATEAAEGKTTNGTV